MMPGEILLVRTRQSPIQGRQWEYKFLKVTAVTKKHPAGTLTLDDGWTSTGRDEPSNDDDHDTNTGA